MKRKGIRIRRAFSNAKETQGSFSDGMAMGILLSVGIPAFILAAAALLSMLK